MAEPKRQIETGVYGITVSCATDGSGKISSDLRSPDDGPEALAAIDALESLVLAHACSGIDICSPAYLEGIETAVDAVTNHVENDRCGTSIVRRYVLYDYDAGDLATTNVYDDYREAADDASALDNVIVMSLVFEKEAGDVVAPQGTQSGSYHLAIDGPAFRSQRKLLLKLQGLAAGRIPNVPDPGDRELLEGLIELTDELADQAHDNHGIDCLLDASEGLCDCERSGHFCSGVPGILAHMENGRLAPGAKVERCDLCQRYPTDEAALKKFRELGYGPS